MLGDFAMSGLENNAWKEVKVFVFVSEDMVVQLRRDDGGRMFLEAATCAMGGECGKEVLGQVCPGGWWAGKQM